MPAEAIRLERRISRRDRAFLAGLACAGVLAVPAFVLLGRDDTRPSSQTGAGCIEAAHAGVLGGGTYRYCGSDAKSFCARFAPAEAAIAGKCAGLGLAAERRVSGVPG